MAGVRISLLGSEIYMSLLLPVAFSLFLSLSQFSPRAGFYPINHTDCLQSYLHHCFDGITGELAHAFFPPTGEIHFDDHEYWVLGNMRFSWKKGLYLCVNLSVTCLLTRNILDLRTVLQKKKGVCERVSNMQSNRWHLCAGVWLTDLVHVAAHEIGHVLGLMHSLNPNAIMHLNATLTGRKIISQDEVWGLHRLYGMSRIPRDTSLRCKFVSV